MKLTTLAINMMAAVLVHADSSAGCKWYKESCAVDGDCCGLDIVNMVSYCQEGACEAEHADRFSSFLPTNQCDKGGACSTDQECKDKSKPYCVTSGDTCECKQSL